MSQTLDTLNRKDLLDSQKAILIALEHAGTHQTLRQIAIATGGAYPANRRSYNRKIAPMLQAGLMVCEIINGAKLYRLPRRLA